jgi:hypothetical protein
MPNRIIKESICTSEEIDGLPLSAEVLFYRLMVNADDHGRFDARLKMVASKCYPLKSIDIKSIQQDLGRLHDSGLVMLYEVDGRPYGMFIKWAKHQQIRAKRAKYPDPETGSDITCNHLQANVHVNQSNPIQTQVRKEPRTVFVKPTVEQVAEYCKERGNGIDAERFVDHYIRNGWKVGTNKMVDWKAAVRTWEKKRDEFSPAKPAQPTRNELFAGCE